MDLSLYTLPTQWDHGGLDTGPGSARIVQSLHPVASHRGKSLAAWRHFCLSPSPHLILGLIPLAGLPEDPKALFQGMGSKRLDPLSPSELP
ncbi:hypothetical protein MHYP_G00072740 [Metynnis hypsauchen]